MLLGLETDPALEWLTGRGEQRLESPPENLQGAVVFEQVFVDLRQTFQNGGIRSQSFTLRHELRTT